MFSTKNPKQGFLQFLIMLAMFVGNIAKSQTQVQVNQASGFEFIPFGTPHLDVRANCVIPGTNTIFSVAQFGVYINREAKGVERVFNSDITLSEQVFSVIGDYNNKSLILSYDGYAYLVDRTTGHTVVAFKAMTSFLRTPPVFSCITTIDNDPTKVYIGGCFDSIVGKTNTPKLLIRYDMVTGAITRVIDDQPYEVGDLIKFKNKLFIGFNYDKNLSPTDKMIRTWDLTTGTFSEVSKGTMLGGTTLVSNGNTLLATGYKQGFVKTLFQYDELTNSFVTLFTGVDEAVAFKGSYYLGTSEFINNTSNETMEVNYFAKYNAELKEISTFSTVIDRNNTDFEQMFAGKDYLLFAGEQAYRFQTVASGIDHKHVSGLVLPNPATQSCSFAVPTDYVGSTMRITSLNGQVISEVKLQNENTLQLPAGIYFIEISNSKFYENRKLVVR